MTAFIKYLALLFFFSATAFSSTAENEFTPYKYWVSFTDKEGTPYTLDNPSAFLSQRSILRRQNQGIALTHHDLPVNPAYLDSLTIDTAVTFYYSSRWLNGALISTLDENALHRISQLSFVENIEYVKPVIEDKTDLQEGPEPGPLKKAAIQSEKSFSDFSYDSHNFSSAHTGWEFSFSSSTYGYSVTPIYMLNGQHLHREGYWGDGKVIAVLDAGYLNTDQVPAFNNLWNTGQILGTRDFVEPKGDIFRTHSHGTLVLSVMGAVQQGEVMGAAPEAYYWLLRTEDARSEFRIEEYNWLAGAEFADSVGADIINSSLGYTRFDDPLMDYEYNDLDGETTIVARAANKAFERGILVVNSAGNYANRPWGYIGSPADSYGALSTGATDGMGLRVSFSSYGPSADGRIKPDIMAQGLEVPAIGPTGQTAFVAGTSFSAPLVSAMAACLWQKHPEASASEIKEVIIKSSHLYLTPDTLLGHGIPDFAEASRILDPQAFEQKYEEWLTVFPNPLTAQSVLQFYSGEINTGNIKIYDIMGKVVYSESNFPVETGFNTLPLAKILQNHRNGVYLLRVELGGNSRVIKALKNWY